MKVTLDQIEILKSKISTVEPKCSSLYHFRKQRESMTSSEFLALSDDEQEAMWKFASTASAAEVKLLSDLKAALKFAEGHLNFEAMLAVEV